MYHLSKIFIGDYRFGFNGQEKDNEVYREGNALSIEYRVHDLRLGRWFSIEPLEKKYPTLSTYCFSNNSPISYKDVDRRDWFYNFTTKQIIWVKNTTEITSELLERYNVGQDKVFGDFINYRGENITFENFVGDQDFVLIESTPWFLERQGYAIAIEQIKS